MTERRKMPDRRVCHTINLRHDTYVGPHKYVVSIGLYDDGSPGEIFMNTEMKAGSLADTITADAAVAASLALQYGCPLDVLRAAMKRTAAGTPMGPLAHALDAVAVRCLEARRAADDGVRYDEQEKEDES
jgi:ribonucleoside-diphosphate reductase alpha chain